jgi:hypothetical protein
VAASRELVVHSGACDHVRQLLEVELTVSKLLLVIDERRQRECLLPAHGVRSGFEVGNMDSCLALVYENDSQVCSIEKNITKKKFHTCKKGNLSIMHYSTKRNSMQSSSLNNITSIQKYNSRISVILIYYYALCNGSK